MSGLVGIVVVVLVGCMLVLFCIGGVYVGLGIMVMYCMYVCSMLELN